MHGLPGPELRAFHISSFISNLHLNGNAFSKVGGGTKDNVNFLRCMLFVFLNPRQLTFCATGWESKAYVSKQRGRLYNHYAICPL